MERERDLSKKEQKLWMGNLKNTSLHLKVEGMFFLICILVVGAWYATHSVYSFIKKNLKV